MSVSSFDRAFHALELQPDVFFEIVGVKVIEGLCAVPAAENVHERLVYNGRVSKSDVGLADKGDIVQHGCWTFFFVRKHDSINFVALRVRMMEDLSPLVGQCVILVNIFENLNLVSTSIYIQSILISYECVISTRLRDLVQDLPVSFSICNDFGAVLTGVTVGRA